jgi:large subunit ribosomal protein L3
MTIYGRKIGMTRYIVDGSVHAITVLQCEPNRVVRSKTTEKDGYEALQVAFGKAKRLNKAELGVFRAQNIDPAKHVREIAVPENWDAERSAVTVDIFEAGQYLDISGTTIGKGFAGCVKRHNFSTQDATHGNSLSHRAPGSIGQCQDPGRVFKGKKMAGRMGGVNRTAKNIELLHVDADKNLLLVKGSVPGHKNGLVKIRVANKKSKNQG